MQSYLFIAKLYDFVKIADLFELIFPSWKKRNRTQEILFCKYTYNHSPVEFFLNSAIYIYLIETCIYYVI